MIEVQDRLDKDVHFVCSLYKAKYEKSKAIQGESIFHVTYTVTCKDDHKLIFHVNCFPNVFEMVINDMFSDNESSMIIEKVDNENDYMEKVVSVLSSFLSYKKSESKDGVSMSKYDVMEVIVDKTKNTTWEHEYGYDDRKRISYDHFILNINHDVMMTITLEYWNKDRSDDNDRKADVLTFTACTTSGTYEKKITNVKISDIMRESVDFINDADRWCCGKIIK